MAVRPGDRRLFRFKKSINHDGVALSRRPAASARRDPAYHAGTAVHRNTLRIWKNDMTAIRDSLWINRTVTVSQPGPVRTSADLAFARPVDRDTRENRLLPREKRSHT